MKTNRLFLALAFALVVGGGNVFAQGNEPQGKEAPDQGQRKRPTPEQMMDLQVKRMVKDLLLDNETEAKFTPLYKEYLEALKGDMDMDKADKREEMKKEEPVEPTDTEIIQSIENRFNRQQQVIDTQKKYFESFKKILNARQLEKVFAPRPQKFRGQPSRMVKNGKKDECFCTEPQGQPCEHCEAGLPPQPQE